MNITSFFKLLSMSLVLSLASLTMTVSAEDTSGFGLFEDAGGFGMQDDILHPDEAFVLLTNVVNSRFIADFRIAEGHYLYKDKLSITAPTTKNISTGRLVAPTGDKKEDPFFNKTLYVFHNDLHVELPFEVDNNEAGEAVFKVKYQGCSEISGICYPPQTREFPISLPLVGDAAASEQYISITPDGGSTNSGQEQVSEQDQIAQSLRSGNTWLTLLIFFGAGLLLAFTPCVFPMIPILSGIIVGQGESITTRKAFGLSLIYVLAMALTYTVVGILVGLSGENIQAWFQNPWIIGSFAAIFVALSFSMFGFYELQMPASIQSKLTAISNSQQGGNLVGVAIMGLLSALIVGPCVTAPLVGALIYIAETGDAVLGGMALFSLSMGMGVPLIIIGASAGKLLPRAGTWMDAIKAVFGVGLLGLAIWMLERVTPVAVTMFLWAALLIVSAVYMGALTSLDKQASGWRFLWKGIGLVLLIYGALLMIGLSAGSRDVFQPLKGLAISGNEAHSEQHLVFQPVKGLDGLNRALKQAKTSDKTVMLDFYADWCISCKEMEALTFTDPGVQQALANTVLLQADVTANDDIDTALYKHFGIIGPPSIMFFDTDGNELKNFRVVGFMPAEQFKQHVLHALQ